MKGVKKIYNMVCTVRKIKSYLHKGANLAKLVYEKNNPSVKFWHLYYFYRCYGNKNGQQNMLKIEKMPFQAKFKTFGDPFFEK